MEKQSPQTRSKDNQNKTTEHGSLITPPPRGPLRARRQPIGIVGFIHCAGGQRERADSRIGLGGLQTVPVDFKEQRRDREPDPLVPVNERMVLYEAKGVSGRQVEDGWLVVRQEEPWPSSNLLLPLT